MPSATSSRRINDSVSVYALCVSAIRPSCARPPFASMILSRMDGVPLVKAHHRGPCHRFLSAGRHVCTGMDAIEEMYAQWSAGKGGGDHWGDVTGEPGGVDYLEVSAGGVPAMWLRPHDAAPGR